MKREIVLTQDGSSSIFLPEWNEHYHSVHGAVQEAYHVFIKNGLDLFRNRTQLDLLEIGFGTGLNAIITNSESKKYKIAVNYIGVEAYPVTSLEISKMNYIEKLGFDHLKTDFIRMHEVPWHENHQISMGFKLIKRKMLFEEIDVQNQHDLIYFDAFGARVQPELWTENIFRKMFNALVEGGVLVTYSAKGSVRRAMQNVGFTVERLSGPPGKREMLRARKI